MDSISQRFMTLYHVGCNDGAAAVWAAREIMGEASGYMAHQYGWKIPREVDGKHLILVDLSLPIEQIEELLSSGRVLSVMVIDHHKSAIPIADTFEECRTFSDYLQRIQEHDNRCLQFIKMNRSGAVLSWMFFNDKLEEDFKDGDDLSAQMPDILRYIEDYDLWHHKLAPTKAINRWLIDGGLTIDRIGESMGPDGKVRDEVIAIGNAYIDYNDSITKSIIKNYVQEFPLLGGTVALINGPHHLRNEITDRLIDKYLFVSCYTVRSELVVYSLRSRKGGFDVSTIAESMGGGGHAEAASFTMRHAKPGEAFLDLVEKPSFWERVGMAINILFGRG